MKLDEINRNILNIILENPRYSYREIAKKVGISVVTVIKRVKKLEKEKVIRSYTTNINYEKIGYDITVIIRLQIAQGKTKEVEEKLASDPNVAVVYDLTGDYDVVVIAKFKTRKKLDVFLKKIQTFDFVERTRTNLILDILKEENIKVN